VAAGLAVYGDSLFDDRADGKLSARERLQQRHFPNVELLTHEGRKVRFYDLVKDKKVVINFMYAQCEGICVPVTSNLVRVQRLLNGRVGRDIHFYSITLKPEQDTPAALRHYMQMHHVGPGWVFLTGEPRTIEMLRKSLGFKYEDPAEDAVKTNHIGMLRYGIERKMRWAACPGQANPEHVFRSLNWEFGTA
jgi:protein SCO1/2